jgi:hypothetical protein
MATALPCADVEIRYKGNGTQKLFTFPFTYISQTHIRVSLWDDTKKEYIDVPDTDWSFANATTIQFFTAPPVPPVPATSSSPQVFNVRIYRRTSLSSIKSTFYPGSAIRAEDLNGNFDQLRLALQEQRCELFGNISLLLEDKVWNKFSIGYIDGKLTGDTITKPDQLTGKWPKDGKDQFIATTDAISSRLDPYVQDNTPAPLGLPNKEQDGKTWFDTNDLVQRFWDADAGAWVTLANAGPVGPQGPKGDTGAYATLVSDTPPATRLGGVPLQQGDVWFNSSKALLYAWYDDGDSKQWVSITKPGPLGPIGPQGLKGDKGTFSTVVNELPPTVRNDGSPIVQGDAWFNTNNAQLYVWYDDGDSKQWVAVDKVGPQGPAGPIGPVGPPSLIPGPAGPIGPLPTVVGHAPITATTVGSNIDLTFDPIPLTFLP